MIKGKIFQLRYLEEVNPDRGKAERSMTTGHLVLTLPKTRPILVPKQKDTIKRLETQKLDVCPRTGEMDFSKIVTNSVPGLEDMPPLEDID